MSLTTFPHCENINGMTLYLIQYVLADEKLEFDVEEPDCPPITTLWDEVERLC